jgi:PadR family transcriptional regulator PadR
MTKNDLVVLGLLREQPMYGYQIKQQIEERQLDRWAHVSLPSIYNTLNRLEKRGLISAHQEKVGRTPERTVFRLTGRGERGLSRLVEKALVSERAPEDDFTVGVAFMYGLDKGKVETCLQRKLELLKNHLAHLKEELGIYRDQIPFNWISLMHAGVDHIQVRIDHVEDMLNTLSKGKTWGDLIKVKGKKRSRT